MVIRCMRLRIAFGLGENVIRFMLTCVHVVFHCLNSMSNSTFTWNFGSIWAIVLFQFSNEASSIKVITNSSLFFRSQFKPYSNKTAIYFDLLRRYDPWPKFECYICVRKKKMATNVAVRIQFTTTNLCTETKSINFHLVSFLCAGFAMQAWQQLRSKIDRWALCSVWAFISFHGTHKDMHSHFNRCNRLSTSSTNHLLFMFYHQFSFSITQRARATMNLMQVLNLMCSMHSTNVSKLLLREPSILM